MVFGKRVGGLNIRRTAAVVGCVGSVGVCTCRSLVTGFLAVTSAVASGAFYATWLVTAVLRTVAEALTGVALGGSSFPVGFYDYFKVEKFSKFKTSDQLHFKVMSD